MVAQIVTAVHGDLKSCTERHQWTVSDRRLWQITCWWIMAPLYKSTFDWLIDWTVVGDQKLGHPDLLYWVLGHRTKCLYLHSLCKQLSCGHQICIVGASDRAATTAWDLTYFSGSQGSKWTKTFWDNQGDTNRNRCTQRLVILYVCTDPLAHLDGHQKLGHPDLLYWVL